MSAAKRCNITSIKLVLSASSVSDLVNFKFLDYYINRLLYLRSKNVYFQLIRCGEVRFPPTDIVLVEKFQSETEIFPAWMLPEVVKSLLEKHYDNDATWRNIIGIKPDGWDLYGVYE